MFNVHFIKAGFELFLLVLSGINSPVSAFNIRIGLSQPIFHSFQSRLIHTRSAVFDFCLFSVGGWLGRAMVMGSFQCRSVLLLWYFVGQEPVVLVAGVGRVGCF